MSEGVFKQHMELARSHFAAAECERKNGSYGCAVDFLFSSMESLFVALKTLTPEQPQAAEPECIEITTEDIANSTAPHPARTAFVRIIAERDAARERVKVLEAAALHVLEAIDGCGLDRSEDDRVFNVYASRLRRLRASLSTTPQQTTGATT